MHLVCLVPTYGRPLLVENALACYEAQQLPPGITAELIVLEDGGQLTDQRGGRPGHAWRVVAVPDRLPSLPAKYARLVELAGPAADAYCVWDDDDVYLPWHLAAHARALAAGHGWSHPKTVWSTYTGTPQQEPAAGRFHGAVCVGRPLLERIGGWVQTLRADFDQQFLARLAAIEPPGDPTAAERPAYVFRWGGTNAPHCQGLMQTPAHEGWYAQVPKAHEWPPGQLLRPAWDADARRLWAQLVPPAAGVSRASWDGLRYWRTADLVADTRRLADQVPPNLAGVAGVVRSGMTPASLLAAWLQLPLFALSKTYGLQTVGAGTRGRRLAGDPAGPLLVVDDSVCNGHAMADARRIMAAEGLAALFAAVYVRPGRENTVDLFGTAAPTPHLFEWNLFNSGVLAGGVDEEWLRGGVALDFDGVLCHDCPPGADGDDTAAGEARYLTWLQNAKPLWLPRLVQVPLVVSFRLRRFMQPTTDWLTRWGVAVRELVLHPARTFAARAKTFDPGEHKGQAFKRSACGLFVESDPRQAAAIAATAQKPVIVPATGQVVLP